MKRKEKVCYFNIKYFDSIIILEMSKWASTHESTRLTTGLSQVGLRKIHFFQKWVEFNPPHLTHGLNEFELG